jgi:pyrimidine-nucleoside phosphorylase
LRELAVTLASELLSTAGLFDPSEARQRAAATLASGAALETLADLVEAQGGRREDVYHPERLPHAPVTWPVAALRDGVITAIEADRVGLLAMRLGAGRARPGDPIDHRVGIRLLRKIGDTVRRGDPLAVLFAARQSDAEETALALANAVRLGDAPVAPPPLLLSRHGSVH